MRIMARERINASQHLHRVVLAVSALVAMDWAQVLSRGFSSERTEAMKKLPN